MIKMLYKRTYAVNTPAYDVYTRKLADNGLTTLTWVRTQPTLDVASDEIAMEHTPREECPGCEEYVKCWTK